MSDPSRWTTPGHVADAVQRRWTDGSLLRALVTGDAFPQIDLPLRGPSAVDLADHYDAAVAWSNDLQRASRNGAAFDLQSAPVGGRAAGRSTVPSRAVVRRFDQAWRLLGVGAEVSAFVALTEQSAGESTPLAWALRRPLSAVGIAPHWPALIAAWHWLDDNRGTGRYLREVSAPGVDTKLVERHRSVLAEWLRAPAGAGEFLDALGLARKPQLIRLRADPMLGLLPAGSTEALLRADEVGVVEVRPTTVLIVENEITYLSVPTPPGGVVLWGRGFDLDPLRAVRWLEHADVCYWGDLDTHGFAILDRLRSFLPRAVSVLMDRETLLAHRPRWGREPQPTRAALVRLTSDEASLYADLVTDALGASLRLEQERIDWEWARQHLTREPDSQRP